VALRRVYDPVSIALRVIGTGKPPFHKTVIYEEVFEILLNIILQPQPLSDFSLKVLQQELLRAAIVRLTHIPPV
jgi:hypothetical protein